MIYAGNLAVMTAACIGPIVVAAILKGSLYERRKTRQTECPLTEAESNDLLLTVFLSIVAAIICLWSTYAFIVGVGIQVGFVHP